ncbi:YqgE/AlgH family protein [soil metagenome]
MRSLKGQLVVASPLLGDPNFERTVVFMVEHGDEGALGLVLNRPSEVEVDRPLADWRALTTDPGVIFIGGPVSKGAIIALARADGAGPGEAWQRISGSIGVLDLTAEASTVATAVDGLRIFTGYSGWGPRQLEAEMTQGAWWAVGADATDPFTAEPDRLWADVVRRQPPPLCRYALYPPDPTVN